MKPLIYSEKEAEEHHMGWQRDGFNISYYQGARKKRMNNMGGGGGVLGSLASASTAASAYSASNAPTSCTGYGPVYYALTFEIMFKCKSSIFSCTEKVSFNLPLHRHRHFLNQM